MKLVPLRQVEFSSATNNEFSTGAYPGVVLRLKLRRKLSYHMLRTYLPSSLFVCLWSFYVMISALEAYKVIDPGF